MTSRQRLLVLLCLLSGLFALLVIWYLPSQLGALFPGDLLPDTITRLAVRRRAPAERTSTSPTPAASATNGSPQTNASTTPNPLHELLNLAPLTQAVAVLASSGRRQLRAPRRFSLDEGERFDERATRSTSNPQPQLGAERRSNDCAHFKRMGGRAFVEAVRSGALRLSDGRKGGTQAVRVVHQSWRTATLPPRFESWSRTWCECFPSWTHVLWTDADNDWFVREHYAWFYRKYSGFKVKISKVDSVRYLYLHAFGGVYTDLDTICYQPFEHLLAGRAVVFGDMEAGWGFHPHFRYIQNSFMYSRAGHPFWLDFVKEIEADDREDVPGQGPVTGPYTLMNLLRQRWSAYPGDFVVYPPVAFNPFSWVNRHDSPCRDLNDMDDALLARCIAHHRSPKTYALEFHTETWRRGSIK